MKIAILISGRITRYESCLLPILYNSHSHEIDIFVSVNDKNEDCKYYNIMKINLQKWLKFISIKEFNIDKEIRDIFNPNYSISTYTPFLIQNAQYLHNNFFQLHLF